jgi:hypothetical protein
MFWLTPYELHVGIMYSQAHAKYTPGLPLAFVAMADRQPYGLAGDTVPDFAALAATF